MKKKNELSLYQNLNGEYYFDENTMQFLMDFTDEQKAALRIGIEHRRAVQAIAYPRISADCMAAIVELMPDGDQETMLSGLRRVDYYKVAMAFNKPADCQYALSAMMYKVDVFKELDDARILTTEELKIISDMASVGINVCKDIRGGIRGDALYSVAQDHADKIAKKDRLRNFYNNIRRPF